MTRRHVPPSRVIVRLAERCSDCDKISYLSRKDAKKERRHFRGSGMNAYPCPNNPTVFHLGHLPPSVVHGLIGREQIHLSSNDVV
jgi:hypothetical protein